MNIEELKKQAETEIADFIAQKIAELNNFRHYPLEADNIFAAIAATNRLIRGAYACVAMIIGHGMVAFRDPNRHGLLTGLSAH